MTTTSTLSDVHAISALLDAYQRALNSVDPDLAASLYAPDGVFMPLFLPTAVGEEILPRYQQIFRTIELDIVFTTDHLSIEGGVAYALTRSQGHVKVLETGLTAPEANRELFVFTRSDEQWKIARYMFNKTSPPTA